MTEPPRFLFATCQVGAEEALKGELARRWPELRFAYSRPGFLTFKLPADHRLVGDFDLESTFARAYGFSLGRARGHDADELAQEAWRIYGSRPVRKLHVWSRDAAAPGWGGFEPSITPEALEAAEAIRRHGPDSDAPTDDGADLAQPARRGDFVLDCVIVEPGEWWVGYHRVKSVPSRWPGGMIPLEMPPEAVSRAWLKMEEALRWSELPVSAGARCAEIGSAPGGASQSLLGRGLEVIGIDPAAMHADVLAHRGFRHVRRRVAEVRRREFRKVRWLTADLNMAPKYTLDAVESIVTHPEVNVRGMLITLKFLEWELAAEIPAHLRRIGGWGFNEVRARQLAHNRHEVCVAALKRPFVRKSPRRRQ